MIYLILIYLSKIIFHSRILRNYHHFKSIISSLSYFSTLTPRNYHIQPEGLRHCPHNYFYHYYYIITLLSSYFFHYFYYYYYYDYHIISLLLLLLLCYIIDIHDITINITIIIAMIILITTISITIIIIIIVVTILLIVNTANLLLVLSPSHLDLLISLPSNCCCSPFSSLYLFLFSFSFPPFSVLLSLPSQNYCLHLLTSFLI